MYLKESALIAPESTSYADILQWIESLPDIETPAWLGLPNTTEAMLLEERGAAVISRLFRLQGTRDDLFTALELTEQGTVGIPKRPAWMDALEPLLEEFLSMLPEVRIDELVTVFLKIISPIYFYPKLSFIYSNIRLYLSNKIANVWCINRIFGCSSLFLQS